MPQSEPTAVGGAGKKSRNSNGGPRGELSQESDSFFKYYNKEIKVNQEEIPVVLYELVDAAYNYIQRESYEKALILLQKTEGVLDVRPDEFLILCLGGQPGQLQARQIHCLHDIS